MPIFVIRITNEQAEKIRFSREGQFLDVKSVQIEPKKLTKTISAFANSDGGELFVGISELGAEKIRKWEGFENQEAANGHLQIFEKLFPLGTYYNYTFLRCDGKSGIVLHIHINKTHGITVASNSIPYIRRGAQDLPQETPELLKRLEYSKGISTFETETINAPKEAIVESVVTKKFIEEVVPSSEPEPWLKKQVLLRDEKPTVAGAVLFSDEPQALIPKHCGIKIYRYKTKDEEGFREALAFMPKTVEGCLYNQIKEALRITTEIVENIPIVGEESLEKISYPPQALHEIITNAIIHRDYSIADDIHIRIFDNRIEVLSPGRLPAHITVDNILDERFARNGAIVRILNKFPDPPNQDVGEGLNTAFAAMHKLGLREPRIQEKDNNVLVTVKHERLASPEEAIMDYLEIHETIKNKEAREITHINADYQIKNIFGSMVKKGLIEQVPGTKTSNTAYRMKSQQGTLL